MDNSRCTLIFVNYFFLLHSLCDKFISQGWLQQAFLKRLEAKLNRKLPFDCGIPDIERVAGQNHSGPHLRSRCFMNNLYFSNLLPHLVSVSGLCLLPGTTAFDRFNLRDWRIHSFDTMAQPRGKEGEGRGQETELVAIMNEGCVLKGALLYHGKVHPNIAHIKGHWRELLRKAHITDSLLNETLNHASHFDNYDSDRNASFDKNISQELLALRQLFQERLEAEEQFYRSINETSQIKDNCRYLIENILVSEGKDYSWVRDPAWIKLAKDAITRTTSLRG